ncbi:TonB-dependent receptor [Sphingomonas prati]|nr:TonB-dependent receptor [Sphingomonas prati]
MLAWTPSTLFAQAVAAPTDGAEDAAFGDIVVTAQKTEQKIADVPLTVTALTGETMRAIGVSELDELAAYVPGLTIQEQSANNPGFVIRGITSDNGSSQQGARVTLYYNGVDISRSRGAYQDLYDLERVEVVKGPQATLFGTAAAIGAISIISAKPEPGFSGALSGGYGNFNRYLASGYLNAGNDMIAGRIAFAYKKRRGYVRNIAGDPDVPNQNQGQVDQRDLNGQDQRGVRASLRYRPSDAVTADLVLTYDGQRNPGTAFKSRAFAPTGGFGGKPFDDYGPAELSGSPYSESVLGARRLGLKRNVYDANFTLAWDVGDGVTLTTVNGYREFNANEVFDADGASVFYLEFAEEARGKQYSHETRLSYTDDHWRAFVGANAFFEKGFQRVPFSTEEGTYLACSVNPLFAGVRNILNAAGIPTGTGCVTAAGTIPATRATSVLTGGALTTAPYSSTFQNSGRNDTYSAFGDVTYIPTPALELTAGARVLIEKRRSGYSSVAPNSTIARASLLGTSNTNGVTYRAEDSFAAVLPRFNILYRLTDSVNAYATVAKGRRSPVVQLDAVTVGTTVSPRLQPVGEETVWNYEAGVKGSVGPVTASAAVYLQKYDDFQVSVTNAGVTTTQSAGTAQNLGFEADATVRLASFLTVFGNFGYIDGGIDKDTRFGAFSGDRFRLQPKYEAAGGVTMRVPAGSLTLFATPSVTYQSKVFFELPNNEAISTDQYTLVNVRAGIEGPGARWTLSGFARNLTDKKYLIDAGNTGGGLGVPTYIAGEPRFYGMEVGVKF